MCVSRSTSYYAARVVPLCWCRSIWYKGRATEERYKKEEDSQCGQKVLPAKLKVEAQSDSDNLDKDGKDDLTRDEGQDCPTAEYANSPEAAGVLDDSSHMFGEGGVFEEYGSSENRSMWMSKFGVFTKSVQADFNTKSKAYGHMLAHQSDREYCRAFFPSGITSGAKKYGHEERCVLLLSILILCSSDGEFFDEKMGSSQASIYILVFSLLLLIEKFFRSPEIQKGDIALLKEFIPIFLALFKRAVNRQAGMGMKFIKFHLLLHLSDDLNQFGPSYSSDSSAGESMHKGFKEDANHTQKNSATFDSQIAKNHSESHAIHRAKP